MPGKGLPKLRGLDHFISFTKEGGQGVYYNCPLIIDGVETPRAGKYITEDLTDLALEFIGKKRGAPFCLYLSHKAVHFGFRPPPHLKGIYKNLNLKLPPESDTWVTFTNRHPFVGALFPIPIPGITAVRTARHKYVEYQNDVRPRELFDLQSDPKEMKNIIGTPEGKRLAEELKKEMQHLQQETGYQFHNRG